jgi:hypothetical protein
MGGFRGLSIVHKIVSFVQDIFPSPPAGDLWQGADASKAYLEGRLPSQAAGNPLRIAFRNLSPYPLLLCWISENGDLNHFYELKPSTVPIDVSDKTVIEGDHIEHTCAGHSFCLAYLPEAQRNEARRLKSLPDVSSIVGGYRPFQHCDGTDELHLVTIGRDIVEKGEEGEGDEVVQCCGLPRLRGKQRKAAFVRRREEQDENIYNNSTKFEWIVTARVAKLDPTPFDTTKKLYELHIIGGWPVYVEPDWFAGDTALERRFEEDLRAASKILPSHAVEYLRLHCPIWINKSIAYGSKACPVPGKGCCYHPDKNWLRNHGLSERKHKCIEINDGPGYKDDVDCWGPGGILVHELSHAYHHHLLPNGYDNKEIIECYRQAMKEKLYDTVKVHGSQAPEARAYACTNDKEYFAELSTAFLGCKDDSKEYNKWYPFNREQLRAHDPRAYKLLCRLWKVQPK